MEAKGWWPQGHCEFMAENYLILDHQMKAQHTIHRTSLVLLLFNEFQMKIGPFFLFFMRV